MSAWQLRFERERAARKEAERLLEDKSLMLYGANRALQALASNLEQQVLDRTLELELALEKATRATHAKSEFLAVMSHEIRTPLHGILGMTELLGFTDLSTAQQAQLHIIRTSGDALLGLVNDILDLSKIEAGKLELEARDFNLHKTLQNLVKLHETAAQNKNIQLNLRLNPQVPMHVNGDSKHLSQIISNLIVNAIKFTQQGEIQVSVTAKSGLSNALQLKIDVSDTGIGIPADRQDRLFKTFSQVDSSTTRQFGGTGLGLAICDALCKAMRGHIQVSSKPGEGSIFTIEVQLATISDATHTQATNHKSESKPSSFHGLKALVVDDHIINQQVAQQLLKKLGFDIQMANDGQQAMMMVQTTTFDLILMDLHMPNMDGLETTRRIRQLSKQRQPYIMALTASAYESDRQASLQAGMDDFMGKPFTLNQLTKKLTTFFEKYPQVKSGLFNHQNNLRHE